MSSPSLLLVISEIKYIFKIHCKIILRSHYEQSYKSGRTACTRRLVNRHRPTPVTALEELLVRKAYMHVVSYEKFRPMMPVCDPLKCERRLVFFSLSLMHVLVELAAALLTISPRSYSERPVPSGERRYTGESEALG